MKRLSTLVLFVVLVLAACTRQPAPELLPGDLTGQAAEDLVINEIKQNPLAVADGAGEWFEIYNSGSMDVDIEGWTIADNDDDTHVIANGGPLIVPAGGYLVLGNNGDTATNGGVSVDYVYPTDFFLANGADELVLTTAGGVEVDRVEWDGGPTFPDPNGASMALEDPALDNNVGSNWCTASTAYGAGDLGTPGVANDCDGAPSLLVINEIMQNPLAVADGAGEWFEIYNSGSMDVDIDGWTIADNGIDSHVIANGGPLIVPAGGYLVLGNNGDSATNGGVSVDYVYGASFFLGNSDDEIVLKTAGGVEVDRVEWDGGPTFPEPNGASMALMDPSLDNNVGSNWCTASTAYGAGDKGTPGAANDCSTPPTIGACGDSATLIHAIQGPGAASPLVNTVVAIEGVVVGDFQEGDGDPFGTDLDGFYLQEEDADQDADPATSEGIFVFYTGPVDVSVGDKVRVLGTVTEYFGLTEITSVSDVVVCPPGAPLPAATLLDLPLTDSERESVEGMLVRFPQDLVISEYFDFDRYGEIVLALPNPSVQDRQFTPTSFVSPGIDAAAVAADNALRRIVLDDGRGSQNPDPARHPDGNEFTLTNRFRGGDLVSGVTGVMDYRFNLYRIQPTEGASYTETNPRPLEHDDVGGDVKVATFNVLNYFLTIDTGSAVCGPAQNQECRGADTTEEFDRQRAKLLAALSDIEADVFGLIEMENTLGVEPLADLVDGLNDVLGAGTYDYVDTGVIGIDAIRVGLIYKTTTVTPLGDYALLDSSVDPSFLDTLNRPVLAQSFEQNADGAVFTVLVNHLKSKGSDCNAVGDPDVGDGQGNCNLTRVAAAEAMLDWIATDPTGSGDNDFLILGDLNSYDEEDPVAVLTDAGFTDLGEAFQGEFAYTYVFDGQFGHLDYALASASLLEQVTGTTNWHINADEPDILDYDMTFKAPAQDALYEPNAFRSSDHDPVIVGLDLDAAPTCGTAAPSIDTLWSPNHKMVSIEIVGMTDPEGDAFTVVIDSIYQDEPVDLAGGSDGNTAPDGAGIGTDVAEVRAERIDGGNGRVYHIAFTATDVHGAACSGTVLVSVPSNRGRNGTAVDDGPIYDSTQMP